MYLFISVLSPQLPGKKYAPGYNADVGDKHIWLKWRNLLLTPANAAALVLYLQLSSVYILNNMYVLKKKESFEATRCLFCSSGGALTPKPNRSGSITLHSGLKRKRNGNKTRVFHLSGDRQRTQHRPRGFQAQTAFYLFCFFGDLH